MKNMYIADTHTFTHTHTHTDTHTHIHPSFHSANAQVLAGANCRGLVLCCFISNEPFGM